MRVVSKGMKKMWIKAKQVLLPSSCPDAVGRTLFHQVIAEIGAIDVDVVTKTLLFYQKPHSIHRPQGGKRFGNGPYPN